jgi:hypothetical protein
LVDSKKYYGTNLIFDLPKILYIKMLNNSVVALRIDDIGASSKFNEIYSKRWFGLGNFLFLKYLPYFKAWGPYREMSEHDWDSLFKLLEKYNAKLTVAVTASWVERDGTCIPFPEKWPNSYLALKRGVNQGLIKIACHGLTHCVLGNKAFLPKLFSSNRMAHREFWSWLPAELHYQNLKKAKEILDSAFETNVDILVPPGNVYSDDTVSAAIQLGFQILNCQTDKDRFIDSLRIIGNKNIIAFHDRELVLFGIQWL